MCFKRELRLATLCHGKRPPPSSIDYVRTTQLCPRKRPFSTANQRFLFTSGEKSGLRGGSVLGRFHSEGRFGHWPGPVGLLACLANLIARWAIRLELQEKSRCPNSAG